MTPTRLRMRGLLLACLLALGLITAGQASALSNGDPCGPRWTEDTPPTAGFTESPSVPLSLEAVQFDGSRSVNGTAEKWTFVSADNKCEATSTEDDPIASYTWDFGDGSPPETDPAVAGFPAHAYIRPATYMVTLTVTEQNCEAGPAAHCFTGSKTLAMI